MNPVVDDDEEKQMNISSKQPSKMSRLEACARSTAETPAGLSSPSFSMIATTENKAQCKVAGAKSLHLPYQPMRTTDIVRPGAVAVAGISGDDDWDEERVDLSDQAVHTFGSRSDRLQPKYNHTGVSMVCQNSNDGAGGPIFATDEERSTVSYHYPGAFPMAGKKGDDYTLTDDWTLTDDTLIIGDEKGTTIPHSSKLPISATLVENREEDYEMLEEQLREKDKELKQILAERENVPVAQVVAHHGCKSFFIASWHGIFISRIGRIILFLIAIALALCVGIFFAKRVMR